jgi:hypothetical protein
MDSYGREQLSFDMTRDGFVLLTMGFRASGDWEFFPFCREIFPTLKLVRPLNHAQIAARFSMPDAESVSHDWR